MSRRTFPTGAAALFSAVALIFPNGQAAGQGVLGGLVGKNAAPEIAGTWLAQANGRTIEMVLKSDGTMTFVGQPGTFSRQGEQLVIIMAGQTGAYGLKLSGDTLFLTGADLGGTLEFKRQGAVPSPAGATAASAAGGAEGNTYTLKADPTVKIGCPKGWTVTEQSLGTGVMLLLAESPAADDAGMLLIVGGVDASVKSSADLAKTFTDYLRQSSYPDLQVTGQRPHPHAPQITVVEATMSSGATPFQSRMWSMVSPDNRVGIFIAFYAPKARYAGYQPDNLMLSCLAPMMGLSALPASAAGPDGGQAAGTGATAAGAVTTGALPVATGQGNILFLRQEGAERKLYSLDPVSAKVAYQANFADVRAEQPARTPDGSLLAFALYARRGLMILNRKTNQSSLLTQPGTGEVHVTNPTFSRDGKLVAMRLRSFQYTGRVDVHDAASGAYDHSFSAIASWFSVLGYGVDDQKLRATYYQDPALPNLMKDVRALGPVYSPKEDILVYADAGKLYVCDGASGKTAREVTLDKPALAFSGLAFTPDGSRVAYFSSAPGGGAFGPGAYAVATVPLAGGEPRMHPIPPAIRPFSASQEMGAVVCLDFSPDGRFVVFSATDSSGGGSEAVALYHDLAGIGDSSDLYALDLGTGRCYRLTSDGKSFDPVWKGR